jgi:copper oxidase (laccase) domain-containing protein
MMKDYLAQINTTKGLVARFLTRVEGVEVDTDRRATVARLAPFHKDAVQKMGFSWDQCWRAEQVHGAEVAIIRNGNKASMIDGVDGLISIDSGVLLGVYVADCGAIYLADKLTGAIGLLHSGKKGTELRILPRAIAMMQEEFGSEAKDLVVVLAPCIRPPAYEVDFASEIREQALEAGVLDENFTDSGICTSQDLGTYYSYRTEMGATGRMLALLGKQKR